MSYKGLNIGKIIKGVPFKKRRPKEEKKQELSKRAHFAD